MVKLVSCFSPFLFPSPSRFGFCTNSSSPFILITPYKFSSQSTTVQDALSIPRSSLVSALVAAVSSCTSSSHCRTIHARVIKSMCYKDGFLGDQLVTCYVKLGHSDDAKKLFDQMPNKDLVSWNSLMSSFSRRGCLDMCLEVFCKMKFDMLRKPNEVTLLSILSACTDMGELDTGRYIHGFAYKIGILIEAKVVNSLINMYGKSNYLYEACRLFESMSVPSIVSWNSVIGIHTNNGFVQEGIDCFNRMRRIGIRPDDGTMVALLQACDDFGVVNFAGGIHALIFSCGLNENVTVTTAVLDLYAKLGRLNSARKVFEEISNPDKVAWTAMVAGFAVHGFGREAVELFESMVKEEGKEPDHVTFTHLLSACSHSGLVKEGKYYFKVMSQVYAVEPRLDHYSCMVDLLGRSGHLNDAYEMIKSMPMEANSGVWGALLGACRVYKNIELGKKVAERLFHLEPCDARNYVMLANIYSASHLWKDASKVRALMKERGAVRNPGCSSIEHGNRIHRFAAGDRSHPETEKIYMKLEELIGKIREAGFVSKTEFVLHDVDEGVKEDMVNKHSEKLAIAFGLLVTDSCTPLVIRKNLRICGDCHSSAKMISLIEKRLIIIRDPKRFHHFADGLCSCGDYW